MRVRITKEIKEIDGEVITRAVAPFGTSAHIPFSKQHTGKIVNVIVPREADYQWILSKDTLKQVVDACVRILKGEKEEKLTFLKRDAVKSMTEKEFSYRELVRVCEILMSGNAKDSQLAERLKKTYNL